VWYLLVFILLNIWYLYIRSL